MNTGNNTHPTPTPGASAGSPWETHLQNQLHAITTAGLRRHLRPVSGPQGREIRIQDRTLLNFSSNDYLGLAAHPTVVEAARTAASRFGAGAGASRLISGSLSIHHHLEEQLAALKETEAALIFSSGYAAAVGAVTSTLGPGDLAILDRLAHACLIDAVRLSGATLRVFEHNNPDSLRQVLQRARQGGRHARSEILVITESVFSMDGDQAPLRELVELKDTYGARLLVDEAHATGLYGSTGAGLVQALGLHSRIEIQMSTLGKALGSGGGFLAGSRAFIDLVLNRARSFIFSTAPVPAASGAALAALALLASPEGETRRTQLRKNAHQLALGLAPALKSPPEPPLPHDPCWRGLTPIHPHPIGDEREAVRAADHLRERGLVVPGIRFPTVRRGEARLRISLSADHTPADIGQLLHELRALPLPRSTPATP